VHAVPSDDHDAVVSGTQCKPLGTLLDMLHGRRTVHDAYHSDRALGISHDKLRSNRSIRDGHRFGTLILSLLSYSSHITVEHEVSRCVSHAVCEHRGLVCITRWQTTGAQVRAVSDTIAKPLPPNLMAARHTRPLADPRVAPRRFAQHTGAGWWGPDTRRRAHCCAVGGAGWHADMATDARAVCQRGVTTRACTAHSAVAPGAALLERLVCEAAVKIVACSWRHHAACPVAAGHGQTCN
jgi:hypothetical protein